MNTQLDAILQTYQQEMVETLQKWIRIPSVKGDAQPGAPFGVEARRALDTAMADCARLGFAVEEFDGYVMHADLGEGNTRDALAVLAHLDVVPTGDGWVRDPFGAQVIDGKIYGRGTSDDKGPAVAALYAMKAIQQAGIPLKRKVRLILGCDEECGSSDMRYYKTKTEMPRSGFSPDACYPLINIEKGGCHIRLVGAPSKEGLQVLSFKTGERANVIPGAASACVAGDEGIAKAAIAAGEKLGFPVSASAKDGVVKIDTTGINGHAAMPWDARNAIGQMLLVLKELGVQGALYTLAEVMGMTYYGEGLGINMEDGVSGKLTCSLGIIEANAETVEALLDIRYPVMMSVDAMAQLIRMRVQDKLQVVVVSSRPAHHVSEHTPLVQQLLEAYHEVTGLEKKALAIGGGTYAQSMEEGVAFGAQLPGELDMAHQANEFMDLNTLYLNARIFANAIVRLAGE